MTANCKTTFFCVLMFLTGCFAPNKSDIRNRIVGKYCNDTHTLILTDSQTYFNSKKLKGIVANTPFQESCKGRYKIEMTDKHWIIRFEKDSHPNSISDCQQEYTLWTEKEGYLIGEGEVTMRDLFDNTPMKRCD